MFLEITRYFGFGRIIPTNSHKNTSVKHGSNQNLEQILYKVQYVIYHDSSVRDSSNPNLSVFHSRDLTIGINRTSSYEIGPRA
jgi:hypothetical protein